MKKYTISILIILIIICFLFFFIKNNDKTSSKIYLDKKMYSQKFTEKSITIDELEKLIKKKFNFIVYFDTPFCTFNTPCETIFSDVLKSENISFYSVSFSDIKHTKLNKQIKYAPTIAIFKNGKLLAKLDPNSDEDTKKIESRREFKKWLSSYVYLDR